MPKYLLILFLCTFLACSSAEDTERKLLRKGNQVGSGVFRASDEKVLSSPKLTYSPSPTYAWKRNTDSKFQVITKEHFRCKGSSLNNAYLIDDSSGERLLSDCKGGNRHSLPLHNEQEFIYPILITLLNEIQNKTGKKLVILSGHRCPTHNEYIDYSKYNLNSKHTIGAEVAFFVEGLENSPEALVNILMEHYKEDTEGKEYTNFDRYLKSDTNVSTQPWYNKEIFIKLHKNNEGHNKEIFKTHPFISVQVRYDREKKQRVNYTWNLAHQNYYRW